MTTMAREGLKVQIGAGEHPFAGWANTDIRALPGISHIVPAHNLPFATESVDTLYWSHGPEHLHRWEVTGTFAEFHRVLRPGGMVYLSCPDFDALLKLYESGGRSLALVSGPLFGGGEAQHNEHYDAWNFMRMQEVLGSAGFRNVRRYDAEEFLPAGVRDYSVYVVASVFVSLNTCAERA